MQLPREAGTPAAAESRSLITQFLESHGYRVQVQRFSFQPVSLNALPVVGAGLGWLTLLQLPLWLWRDTHPYAALGTWFFGAASLGVLAWGIGTGVEVPGAEKREDANLIATQGTAPVERWIVAHIDTKAQGHSMLGRIVAVWMLLAATVAITCLSIARSQVESIPLIPAVAVSGLALAAGALAARGRLKGTTPGARDNGTGLLAALTAASLGPQNGVGFLFTGAEEFGLVGARIAVQGGVLGRAEVVNVDTLDQEGTLFLVYHDSRGEELAGRLRPMLERLGVPLVTRRLPLGILTDSLPCARKGLQAVTLGRLTRGTLRLIHTPRDVPEGLDLSLAEAVGRVLGKGEPATRTGVDQAG